MSEVFGKSLGVCSTVEGILVNSLASSTAKLRVAVETSHKVLPDQTTHTHHKLHSPTFSTPRNAPSFSGRKFSKMTTHNREKIIQRSKHKVENINKEETEHSFRSSKCFYLKTRKLKERETKMSKNV